ncbi:MAG: response regulator [Cytophagaceae bacterium]|nr:MAG: response regulator [Cytophagaceae bacterium]
MDQQTPTVQAILLVEDQPLIRMSVVDFLVDQGYRVEEAGTASFAIERIHTLGGQLGALILDLGLPDRPGAMVAREIRFLMLPCPVLTRKDILPTQVMRKVILVRVVRRL